MIPYSALWYHFKRGLAWDEARKVAALDRRLFGPLRSWL